LGWAWEWVLDQAPQKPSRLVKKPLAQRHKETRDRSRTEKIVLCICGLAGSGKSTVAKKLAERYGLKYYSGGDALKSIASEMGYGVDRAGWWEGKEGIEFLEQRMENLEFDKKTDIKLMEWAEQGNVVLDSWTMPWLLRKGFKVWLEASEEVRAKRVAHRDHMSLEEALEYLRKKENKTKTIFKRLYGFDLGEDFTPFHLILDVDLLDVDEVFQVLCKVIENLDCGISRF